MLQVLPVLCSGAGAIVCVQLSRGLLASGCQVEILSLRAPEPNQVAAVEAAGIPVHTVQMRSLFDRSIRSELDTLLRRLQPDVVHCHHPRPDIYGGAAAHRTGVPVILTTVHAARVEVDTYAYGSLRAWFGYLWDRYALHHYHDAVVFVSNHARRHMLELPFAPLRHPHISVIHNGLDPQPYLTAQQAGPAPLISQLRRPGRPLIGAVGRLVKLKNFECVIEALAALRNEGVVCDLILVGSGPHCGVLQSISERLEVSDQVHFLGYQSDVPGIMAGLDFYVHPALTEGLPLALIEAMLMGRPIVASTAGGIPEIIRHGETGLLFSPSDKTALLENLHQALNDKHLCHRLGNAAQEYALRHLTREVMTRAYLDLYNQLLASKGRQRAV